MDDNLYFDLPGNLRKIYWPSGGIDASRYHGTSTFYTGAGGARVTKALDAVRTYAFDYAGLGQDNFAYLESFDQGHMGVGPFVLIDPSRRNLLTVNQSSVTSDTNDTRGFTVAGTGGSISSDNTVLGNCPNTLKWLFGTSTPGTSTLSLNRPSTVWTGIPVIPRPYTFWFIAVGGGTDGIVSLTANISWYQKTGTFISTSSGSAVSTAPGVNSADVVCTATAPANAAFALCSISASSASISAGDSVNIFSLMFQEGSAQDAMWKPGTGIFPVAFISQADISPYMSPDFRKGNSLLLQEVK